MTDTHGLSPARDEARAVRALYETLEQRLNGRTWSSSELMIGFSNDVGHIGRLLLAHEGTWAIDGDVDEELAHKLSEALWWVFVLSDRLGIDIDDAFARTMSTIREGLTASVARLAETAPDTDHLSAADDPERVRVPAVRYVSIEGAGSPGTDEFYRKMRLAGDLARRLGGDDVPVIEIMYWYPEGSTPVEIADFYTVNPVPSLRYRVLARVDDDAATEDLRAARTDADAADEIRLLDVPAHEVVQALHHGPFADEHGTLARLGALARERGLRRSGPHHELHLDGFTRDTPQETLRTILRDPVE